MTKEEFIDKIGIVNQTIENLTSALEKIKQTKQEAVTLYIQVNRVFKQNKRVKVYKNKSTSSNEKKEFVGYGYVQGALVDEDYGIIFYPIIKEDKKTKIPTNEKFAFSEAGVSLEDYEYCSMLLERA